jgi:plasmid stabilization system protein ParE
VKALSYNPESKQDLLDIWDYISINDSLMADKIVSEIVHKIEMLMIFPEMGSSLQNQISQRTNHRYLVSGNYMIIYYIDNNVVMIVRVVHTSRNLEFLKI